MLLTFLVMDFMISGSVFILPNPKNDCRAFKLILVLLAYLNLITESERDKWYVFLSRTHAKKDFLIFLNISFFYKV